MAYTRYNVVRAGDPYKDREGKERTTWEQCGTLLRNEETGSLSLKLFLTGEWYSCFEDTTRERRDAGGPDRIQDPTPTNEKRNW